MTTTTTEVHRHGNRHLGVVGWIEANLTLSHIQMLKCRHASMKKTSSTAAMLDVPRLTSVMEDGIGTTFHTLVTERYYVPPQWASGEDQSASQPTRKSGNTSEATDRTNNLLLLTSLTTSVLLRIVLD